MTNTALNITYYYPPVDQHVVYLYPPDVPVLTSTLTTPYSSALHPTGLFIDSPPLRNLLLSLHTRSPSAIHVPRPSPSLRLPTFFRYRYRRFSDFCVTPPFAPIRPAFVFALEPRFHSLHHHAPLSLLPHRRALRWPPTRRDIYLSMLVPFSASPYCTVLVY